jgi:O-antigen/teichoic acid export membrane protein
MRRFLGSQLRRNIASGVVVSGINILVLLASYRIYLHFLGYERLGLWLVLATVISLAQLGMLGVKPAVMKLVAEDYGRNDLAGVQRFFWMGLLILSVTGSIVLAAILVFETQVIAAFKLDDESARVAARLLPYVGMLSVYTLLVQVVDATLSGLGRMDLANYANSSGRVVSLVISTGMLYAGYNIESILVGNTLWYVTLHSVEIVIIRRALGPRIPWHARWDPQRLKRLVSFGVGVFGGSMLNMLLTPFNRLMLSRYAGLASIPVYDIAYNSGMQVRHVVDVAVRALMPEISRVSAGAPADRRARVDRLNRKSLLLILGLGVPSFTAAILFATPALKLWLGDRFVEPLPTVFRVMLVGTFMSLLGVPAYYTLMGLGRVRCIFASHAVQSLASASIVLVVALAMADLPVVVVIGAFAAGAALSSGYLLWHRRRAAQAHDGAAAPRDEAESAETRRSGAAGG